MSPTARPVSATSEPVESVPGHLLGDGETVILAVRPSAWSILLTAWPAIALLAAVGGVMLVLDRLLGVPFGGYRKPLVVLLAAVCALRLTVSAILWAGKLYVLTNFRLLKVQGLLEPRMDNLPLGRVNEARLAATPAERSLGVGNLYFVVDGQEDIDRTWEHIARPEEVRESVEEAIRRIRPRD